MNRTSIQLEDETIELADAIVRNSAADATIPSLNRSEALRLLLHCGADAWIGGQDLESVEALPDLRDLIPQHRVALYRRERFMNGEGKFKNLRNSFEARVRHHYEKRFADGWTVDGLEGFAENMKRDAHILWPEDDDRRDEAIDYVDDVVNAAIAAAEQADYDPRDAVAFFEDLEYGSQQTPDHQRDEDAVGDQLDDVEYTDRVEQIGYPVVRAARGADYLLGGGHYDEALDRVIKESGSTEATAREALKFVAQYDMDDFDADLLLRHFDSEQSDAAVATDGGEQRD